MSEESEDGEQPMLDPNWTEAAGYSHADRILVILQEYDDMLTGNLPVE